MLKCGCKVRYDLYRKEKKMYRQKVYSKVGQKLKQLRKQNKKTQEQIADILDVTKQSYYRYEKAIRNISIFNLLKLANYFNVSLNYFVK